MLAESIPPTLSSTLVCAFPMLPERILVGVVSLHVRPSRPLARTTAELDFLANVLGAAIVGGVPVDEGSHAVWSERDKVSQATGMIVAQLRIAPGDALAVLRAHAFAHEASVAEISRAVLSRQLVFVEPGREEL